MGCYVLNTNAEISRHIAEIREDNETRQNAGHVIAHCQQNGIPEMRVQQNQSLSTWFMN